MRSGRHRSGNLKALRLLLYLTNARLAIRTPVLAFCFGGECVRRSMRTITLKRVRQLCNEFRDCQ